MGLIDMQVSISEFLLPELTASYKEFTSIAIPNYLYEYRLFLLYNNLNFFSVHIKFN